MHDFCRNIWKVQDKTVSLQILTKNKKLYDGSASPSPFLLFIEKLLLLWAELKK